MRMLTDDNIPTADSTFGRVHGIDSKHMKRAVLYARVSADLLSIFATVINN
jgi:hypothetical protein